MSEAECRAACDQSSECKFYIFFTNGMCSLKKNAFNGNCGSTRYDASVNNVCFQVY